MPIWCHNARPEVGRHGAVVLVVEKDAPVPAPAPPRN